MSGNYTLIIVFIMATFAIGCIAEDGNMYSGKSLNVSQIYSTFDSPHSLEIISVSTEDNFTKVVYVNEEDDTVIFSAKLDSSNLVTSGVVIIMNDVEVHIINRSYYQMYVWIINDYRFSIIGTNETISYDFVEQMISHTTDVLNN